MDTKDIIIDLNKRATDAIADYIDNYELGDWKYIYPALKLLRSINQEVITLMHFIYTLLPEHQDLKSHYTNVIKIYNKIKKVLTSYDD